MSQAQPDPSQIVQVGMGFWPSETLLSAVVLELFTHLGEGSMTGEEVQAQLDLHPRGTHDFLDALVALGFLEREGEGSGGRYQNTPETATFLDKRRPTYIGGILEMANARLYRFWGDLTDALRTGEPQNEIKHSGKPMFEELYSDPARLEQFMEAMQGLSLGNFHALAEKFDFSRYETVCDVGGATGQLSTILATHHPTYAALASTCRSSGRSRSGPSPRRGSAIASLSPRATSSRIRSQPQASPRWG